MSMTNKTTIRWVLVSLIVLAGIYVIADHGQHVLPYLPLAFLSGCLFMHLFGHGGHGMHDQHAHDEHAKKDS